MMPSSSVDLIPLLFLIAKRFNHRGHIVQQGINNGTVRLHLSDESGAGENGKKLIIYFSFDLL